MGNNKLTEKEKRKLVKLAARRLAAEVILKKYKRENQDNNS